MDDDPFFAQLAQVIEQQAMERNYPVRLSYSVLDIKMIPTLEKIESANVDGAIVLGRFSEAATAFLECHYKNIVYVGRNLIHAEWDQVICDGYEATQMAIEHLVSYGHRRIGYIGETGDEIRYQAYRDMICKCGLEDNRRLVCNVPTLARGDTGERICFCAQELGCPPQSFAQLMCQLLLPCAVSERRESRSRSSFP